MPYKDLNRKREYARQWKQARRDEFLGSSICAHCGATDDLQVHHIDPAEKKEHRIWTWSRERILDELTKCQILCRACHIDVHWHGLEVAPVEWATEQDQIMTNLEASSPRRVRAGSEIPRACAGA